MHEWSHKGTVRNRWGVVRKNIGGFKVELLNQIEVLNDKSSSFSEKGDSGALVFDSDNKTDLRPVGMIVGGTSQGSTAITPMSDIMSTLDTCRLTTFVDSCPEPESGSGNGTLQDQLDLDSTEQITDPKTNLDLIITDEVLGYGAASVVFKGTYNKMPVAVKKILYTETKVKRTEREREILSVLEHLRHDNIIGFYMSQFRKPYLYLVLELCLGTLEDYVKPENGHWKAAVVPSQVNKHMAEGLRFVHSKCIVHRDLKPSNVLFRFDGNGRCKVCLSDFGVAKESCNNEFSVSGHFGTREFWAPEVHDIINGLENSARCDTRSDTFALGIMLHYSYLGTHPFGSQALCQANIINGNKALTDLYDIDYACACLVETMLDKDPNKRPDMDTVCEHPAHWSDDEAMDFFIKMSDALEHENANIRGTIQHSRLLPGNNWLRQLPTHLQNYLRLWECPPGKRYYKGHESSTYHLLRAIRNTNHHFLSYPNDAKKELGTFPTEHVKLWKDCCPKLLLHLRDSLPSLRMVWDRTNREIKKF